MPQKPLTDAQCQEALDALERAGGVVEHAAASLGIARGTFQNRLNVARMRPHLKPTPVAPGDVGAARDRVYELESQLRAIRRDTLDVEYVKRKLIGITEKMDAVQPPPWTLRPIDGGDGLPGVPTLFMSDWHAGEVVHRGQLNGVNEFNMEIMRVRARRLVERAVHLLTRYVVNPTYPGIVAPLGGDLLSGDIHEELRDTNEAPTPVVLLELVEVLMWVLTTLADQFGQVFVPGVAGNHGRLSQKPRAKNRAFTNWDWLLLQFLRKALAHDERITFFVPDGPDAWYRIYGHRYLLTHGDQFRGGDSQIGALGPVTRGNKRKQTRNTAIDLSYDTMLLGHWHQWVPMMDQIINGSLKGYDEYAAQMNFPFQVPIQGLWMTHPRYGITQSWPIYLEEPARGTQGRVDHNWISWKDAA